MGGAGPRGGRRKRGVLPVRLGGKTCRVGGGGNEGNGYRITMSGRGVGARGYGFARSMAVRAGPRSGPGGGRRWPAARFEC